MPIPETKPRTDCTVVDRILPWTDENGTLLIHVGDLVLWDRKFEQVSTIHVGVYSKDDPVAVHLDGHSGVYFVYPTELVAVRRYVETSSQDTEEPTNG